MGNEIVPVVDKDMTQILDPEEQQRSRNDAKKRQKMPKVVNALSITSRGVARFPTVSRW